MDHRVHLESLPDVQFPAELQDRISYDPNSKQLRFEGFMSKASFDMLRALDKSPSYVRALEELFRISTDVPESKKGMGKILGKLFLATPAILALVAWSLYVFAAKG